MIPWVLMWTLSLAIWAGFKWLTWRRIQATAKVDFNRSLAYLFLWPGMDAREFLLENPRDAAPARNTWMFGLIKMLLGASLFWGIARCVPSGHPLWTGWVGLFGLIFLLHFGSFHLIALVWQKCGIRARPLMKNPLKASSLSDFWSHRWNLAFRQLAHQFVFQPLHRRMGADAAMFVAFLGSGLIHDLVISLPAQGGYGLPTAYFATQGLGMMVERSSFGRRMGLGKGFVGWAFALLIAAGPAYWLFHPLFIGRVILPFMSAMGAIKN